ncbi:MAG: hypothetical protein ACYDB1_03385 [Acidiferrobacteraceae bacterium]
MQPDPISTLSDHLADLKSSPEKFSQLYRYLLGLRFPLDIAEILELRSLLNQVIDQCEDCAQQDPRMLRELHRLEFETLGVAQPVHKDRLSRLMAALRTLHLDHGKASHAREDSLRKALADNRLAQERSLRYGRFCSIPTLVLAIAWILSGPDAWLIKAGSLILGYLFCDYFHSLIVLKKKRRLLDRDLAGVVANRIPGLNWRPLMRQLALVLGYGRVNGVEAFVLQEQPEPLLASA